MKRIGILTAGGDTPALNATIHGAVIRANELKVEVYGLIKGFSSLFNPRVPHVHLNPLFQTIPELEPTMGGTIIGASRAYLSQDNLVAAKEFVERLHRLKIEGLICVGGDGTLNGMQPLTEFLPVVLAPKTIDNDLGLNYAGEPDEWQRKHSDQVPGYAYERLGPKPGFDLERMINFVTPGFATAVYVSAGGVQRIRTTAESHRRIAITEVMGRHSGFIAMGAAYGRPDIILVPEHSLEIERLVERIKELYELQKNVVIVCGEGIVDGDGNELGVEKASHDPSGNKVLIGAANTLRQILIERMGDTYFKDLRRGETAAEVIFTRRIGHTQRGGRPLRFDRFYAAQLGGKAVDLLWEGRNNEVAVLQWNRKQGFHLDHFKGTRFRDRWGHIHARQLPPSFYDPAQMKPSRPGIEYLMQILTHAIGQDDVESIRESLFAPGNLLEMYHSPNTDMSKRIRYLEEANGAHHPDFPPSREPATATTAR